MKKEIVSASVEREETRQNQFCLEVIEIVVHGIGQGQTQEVIDELENEFGKKLKLESVEADSIRGKIYGDKVRKESSTRLDDYLRSLKNLGFKFE